MKLRYIWAALAIVQGAAAQAEVMSLDSCLNAVTAGNLALAAERLNIPIAEAEEHAAKVFNDPTLGFEYGNNDDHRMQMGQSYSVELGYTLSPGKRGARKNLARSERELAEALLDDYLRRLRLEAATAYMDVVKAECLYRLADSLNVSMVRIAQADSIGAAIGQVREVDAMSTHIASHVAEADAAAAATELRNARLALATMMGCPERAALIKVDTEGSLPYPDVDEAAAIETAIERRADLRAALKNVEVEARRLKVERAERNLEFDLALGYSYNTEVRNEIAPAPRFGGITVGVSIPLKFSNTNKGAVTAARLRRDQAELQAEQAEQEVRTQVVAAIDTYRQARSMYAALDHRLLAESREIYNSYLAAYRHGDVSLVELMEMRNGFSDILRLHIEAAYNLGVARAAYLAAIGR